MSTTLQIIILVVVGLVTIYFVYKAIKSIFFNSGSDISSTEFSPSTAITGTSITGGFRKWKRAFKKSKK